MGALIVGEGARCPAHRHCVCLPGLRVEPPRQRLPVPRVARVSSLQPFTYAHVPTVSKLPIQRLKMAIGLPSHAPRLWRKALVEAKGPGPATKLFQLSPDSPASAGDATRLAIVLGLVSRAVALPTTKVRAPIDHPAAFAARGTFKPMALSTELCRRPDNWNDLVDPLWLAAPARVVVAEP